MKKYFRIFLLFLILISPLVLSSCNKEGDFFKIEGRFLNLNQGEFYVYSTDGGLDKLDTIRVQDGRFAYQAFIDKPATFIIVFPNFSEQVVFGEPSRTAKIKGDATHLKEMEVSGTKANRLMTSFRQKVAEMSPPQTVQAVEDFVSANLESPVSTYLISRYLVKTSEPDYAKATKLLKQVIAANPNNRMAKKLKNQAESLAAVAVNQRLPKFKAKTIDGTTIDQSFCKGKVGVIVAWASWNYESQNLHRRLNILYSGNESKMAVLGVSLDADKRQVKQILKNDEIEWPVVCDGEMLNSELSSQLGICYLPDNLVIDKQGKIIARSLDYDAISELVMNP